MKKITIALLLTLYLGIWTTDDSYGQGYIENKTLSAKIYATAMNTMENTVRFKVLCDIADIDSVVLSLPTLSISDFVITSPTTAEASGIVLITSLWQIRDTTKAEQSDVGRTFANIEDTFGAVLIFNFNPLQLNLSKWAIKED